MRIRPVPGSFLGRMLAALAMLAGAAALQAEIEFIGILVSPPLHRFALTNTETGKTDWVERGRLFSGYTVSAYDARHDTLTLTRDGAELKLKLKDDAKIKSSRLEVSGTIKLGAGEKLEIERATLLLDQENVFPLKDGLVYRITPTRLDDGTMQYEVTVERRLAENKTEKIAAPKLRALAGQPFALHLDDLVFAFTPR